MIRLVPALALALAAVAAFLASGCAPVVVAGAAAGGVAVAVDRRPADVQLADERIEWTSSGRVSDKLKDQGHVNVTSYNKMALLTGEATTEAMKQEAEKITAAVPEVKSVVNDLQIAAPTQMSSRSNDAYLTSVVKTRFVGEQKFNPLHVKVVTENGVVYLLGLVTRKEADDASNIARHVSGVKKVVRVFEYIPDPPPAKPAAAPAKP
ncbi:MAG: BON domain-containing protein [Bacteroidota bacterium]|jgi:osmotically-inducible protein OsmY